MNESGGLTFEEIVIACRNVGINLDCGGCAENFYTGYNDPTHHNESCTLKKNNCPDSIYNLYIQRARVPMTELFFDDLVLLVCHSNCCGKRYSQEKNHH